MGIYCLEIGKDITNEGDIYSIFYV